MRPSALPCTALLLLATCSTPPRPVAPAPTPAEAARAALATEVAALSAKAEALLHAQDELVWKSWTEGTSADLAQTYAGTELWLTPAAMDSVQRLRMATGGTLEPLALTHLHAYLVTEWLAQKTAGLSEEAAKLEETLTFGPAGQERPYRNLESLLASERSALLRKTLYEEATPAVARLAEVLARRRQRTEALLAELGLSSSALLVELRESELEPLVALANQVLTRTEGAFNMTLSRLSWTELQLPVERVTRADIPRLFRLPALGAAFPKAEVFRRAASTLQGLGIDVATMKNVTLDLKETPGKNPRGLVLGVVIPSDVRVSLLPVGGSRDERETLHQMGHLLSDALSQEKRWALAKLGNRTVGEAWAFLLEDLTVDPTWLDRVAGLTGDAQVAWRTSADAQRLFLLRRAAGKVLFNAGARAPDADMAALYRDVMARTYGFPMTAADEARAELDREEFLASADYLQAFVLAAQLEQQLRGRFGLSWWQEAAAGEWVRKLLAPGNSETASGLAHAMGLDGLDVEAFLTRVPTTLGGTPPNAPPTRDSTPDGGLATAPPTVDAGGAPAAPAADAGPTPAPDTVSDAGTPAEPADGG
ncbi:MAG: chromosome segregation protein SMC [Myxococcaceae bacterium]